MPEEDGTPQRERLDELLPESVYKALLENGVDLNDEKVQRAVMATALAYQKFRLESGFGLGNTIPWARMEYFREAAEDLRERQALEGRQRQQITFATVAGIAAGLAGLATALVTGFSAFKDAIKSIYPFSQFFGEITGIFAYAQTPGASVVTGSQVVVPIFVYAIYVVLGTAYVVCLIGLFLGRLPKDRANAMEIVKMLTGFFIGVASGKFI